MDFQSLRDSTTNSSLLTNAHFVQFRSPTWYPDALFLLTSTMHSWTVENHVLLTSACSISSSSMLHDPGPWCQLWTPVGDPWDWLYMETCQRQVSVIWALFLYWRIFSFLIEFHHNLGSHVLHTDGWLKIWSKHLAGCEWLNCSVIL